MIGMAWIVAPSADVSVPPMGVPFNPNRQGGYMPSFVIAEKCDGCKGGDKTACMYICPNDLMVLDPNQMKAYNQEPDQCWECFSCVKICPTQAIEVRGYADFVPLGSSIMPMMGTEDVMWTCKFRNGTIKRFKFPIRTTPEGMANAYTDLKGKDLESGLLSTEEADGYIIPRPKTDG
jgi:adenylylsulfate reductase subunit B